MKRLLIVVALFAHSSPAQINMSKIYCPGTDPSRPKISAFIPATVILGTNTVMISVPTCLDLGPNLKINGSELDAIIPAAPPAVIVPKLQMEKIGLLTLNPSSDPAVTKATFNLLKAPITDGVILAVLRSSVLGGDLVDITRPDPNVTSKTLTITLPTYRPYTATDMLTVVYYTLE